MSVQGLKRLKVWARTMDFALKIYKEVLPLMPAEEKMGIEATTQTLNCQYLIQYR